ncbi:hypothetical protein TOL_2922 [Thalassolituus oleivorans MIL-1]|uniref:Uncharacterized protein n=1 Tax=Thalassolituus oleivorans MIL-1 TaxID=1298593 RepID=M5DVK4_9GAMM|nr:hypothetical protein TOL_2922 [Thalassolituus oleivorans MIL-1]
MASPSTRSLHFFNSNCTHPCSLLTSADTLLKV